MSARWRREIARADTSWVHGGRLVGRCKNGRRGLGRSNDVFCVRADCCHQRIRKGVLAMFRWPGDTDGAHGVYRTAQSSKSGRLQAQLAGGVVCAQQGLWLWRRCRGE
eukprot:scaffold46143_cov26-Tisochrysis_lutea.AAC.11